MTLNSDVIAETTLNDSSRLVSFRQHEVREGSLFYFRLSENKYFGLLPKAMRKFKHISRDEVWLRSQLFHVRFGKGLCMIAYFMSSSSTRFIH